MNSDDKLLAIIIVAGCITGVAMIGLVAFSPVVHDCPAVEQPR